MISRRLYLDFDGTLTGAAGAGAVNSDLYRSLLENPNAAYQQATFVSSPTLETKLAEGLRQQSNAAMKVQPEAIVFLNKMLDENAEIVIVSRNREEYIRAMLKVAGLPPEKIARIIVRDVKQLEGSKQAAVATFEATNPKGKAETTIICDDDANDANGMVAGLGVRAAGTVMKFNNDVGQFRWQELPTSFPQSESEKRAAEKQKAEVNSSSTPAAGQAQVNAVAAPEEKKQSPLINPQPDSPAPPASASNEVNTEETKIAELKKNLNAVAKTIADGIALAESAAADLRKISVIQDARVAQPLRPIREIKVADEALAALKRLQEDVKGLQQDPAAASNYDTAEINKQIEALIEKLQSNAQRIAQVQNKLNILTEVEDHVKAAVNKYNELRALGNITNRDLIEVAEQLVNRERDKSVAIRDDIASGRYYEILKDMTAAYRIGLGIDSLPPSSANPELGKENYLRIAEANAILLPLTSKVTESEPNALGRYKSNQAEALVKLAEKIRDLPAGINPQSYIEEYDARKNFISKLNYVPNTGEPNLWKFEAGELYIPPTGQKTIDEFNSTLEGILAKRSAEEALRRSTPLPETPSTEKVEPKPQRTLPVEPEMPNDVRVQLQQEKQDLQQKTKLLVDNFAQRVDEGDSTSPEYKKGFARLLALSETVNSVKNMEQLAAAHKQFSEYVQASIGTKVEGRNPVDVSVDVPKDKIAAITDALDNYKGIDTSAKQKLNNMLAVEKQIVLKQEVQRAATQSARDAAVDKLLEAQKIEISTHPAVTVARTILATDGIKATPITSTALVDESVDSANARYQAARKKHFDQETSKAREISEVAMQLDAKFVAIAALEKSQPRDDAAITKATAELNALRNSLATLYNELNELNKEHIRELTKIQTEDDAQPSPLNDESQAISTLGNNGIAAFETTNKAIEELNQIQRKPGNNASQIKDQHAVALNAVETENKIRQDLLKASTDLYQKASREIDNINTRQGQTNAQLHAANADLANAQRILQDGGPDVTAAERLQADALQRQRLAYETLNNLDQRKKHAISVQRQALAFKEAEPKQLQELNRLLSELQSESIANKSQEQTKIIAEIRQYNDEVAQQEASTTEAPFKNMLALTGLTLPQLDRIAIPASPEGVNVEETRKLLADRRQILVDYLDQSANVRTQAILVANDVYTNTLPRLTNEFATTNTNFRALPVEVQRSLASQHGEIEAAIAAINTMPVGQNVERALAIRQLEGQIKKFDDKVNLSRQAQDRQIAKDISEVQAAVQARINNFKFRIEQAEPAKYKEAYIKLLSLSANARSVQTREQLENVRKDLADYDALNLGNIGPGVAPNAAERRRALEDMLTVPAEGSPVRNMLVNMHARESIPNQRAELELLNKNDANNTAALERDKKALVETQTKLANERLKPAVKQNLDPLNKQIQEISARVQASEKTQINNANRRAQLHQSLQTLNKAEVDSRPAVIIAKSIVANKQRDADAVERAKIEMPVSRGRTDAGAVYTESDKYIDARKKSAEYDQRLAEVIRTLAIQLIAAKNKKDMLENKPENAVLLDGINKEIKQLESEIDGNHNRLQGLTAVNHAELREIQKNADEKIKNEFSTPSIDAINNIASRQNNRTISEKTRKSAELQGDLDLINAQRPATGQEKLAQNAAQEKKLALMIDALQDSKKFHLETQSMAQTARAHALIEIGIHNLRKEHMLQQLKSANNDLAQALELLARGPDPAASRLQQDALGRRAIAQEGLEKIDVNIEAAQGRLQSVQQNLYLATEHIAFLNKREAELAAQKASVSSAKAPLQAVAKREEEEAKRKAAESQAKSQKERDEELAKKAEEERKSQAANPVKYALDKANEADTRYVKAEQKVKLLERENKRLEADSAALSSEIQTDLAATPPADEDVVKPKQEQLAAIQLELRARQKEYAEQSHEQTAAAKDAAQSHEKLLDARKAALEKAEKALKEARDTGKPAEEIEPLTKAVTDATAAVTKSAADEATARARATAFSTPDHIREEAIRSASSYHDVDFAKVIISLPRYKTLLTHIEDITHHAPNLWINSEEAKRFPSEVEKRKNSLHSFIHSAQSKIDLDPTLDVARRRELQAQIELAHECLDCIDRIKANYVKLHAELAKPDSDRQFTYLGSGPGGDKTDDYQEALDAAANHLGMARDAAAGASFCVVSPAAGAIDRTAPTTTKDFEHRWYPADIKYMDKNNIERVIKGAVVQTQTSGGFITKPMYAKDDLKKFKDLKPLAVGPNPPTIIPNIILLEEAQKLFLSHMSKKNPYSETKTITLNNVDKAPSEEFVRAFYLICKKEGYEVIASPASPLLERIKKYVDDNPTQHARVEEALGHTPALRKLGVRTASDDTVAKMLEDTEHRPHGPGH